MAVREAYASTCPRPPQPQRRPPLSTTRCPISPALPLTPVTSFPPVTTAPPTPVPTKQQRKSDTPCPAPNASSPVAATCTSLRRVAGTPNRLRNDSAIGKSMTAWLRFGVPKSTPFAASTCPAAPTPMPTSSFGFILADCSASSAAPWILSMIVCGLSAAEVRFLAVETTSPLSRSTTAASSFVPPKSIPSACRFAISAPFLAEPRSSLARIHAGIRPPSRGPAYKSRHQPMSDEQDQSCRQQSPTVQFFEHWCKLLDGFNR